MIADVGSWLLTHLTDTIFSFTLITLLLTPLWMLIKEWADPKTPGGLGDLPDVHGVKAWERLATSEVRSWKEPKNT